MTNGRIYPVPIKPPSNIGMWHVWPDDVRPILHGWNNDRDLSFVRAGVFKCADCEEFCESHKLGRAELRGLPLCDDCLIARARDAALSGRAA
jgi:hypothetical protein